MKIVVERPTVPGPDCTISECYVDGVYECFILEDQVREVEGEPVEKWKVKGETAIPKGTYGVIVNESTRFKRLLPLLRGVPGFSGVRIHPGNTSEDTEGCLLPGRTRTEWSVGESKVAFGQLFDKIKAAIDEGDSVTLEIR